METRVFASSGPEPIPPSAFDQIRETIRAQTRLCLEQPIGVGGTGVVFIAKHEDLPLRRAVKVVYYGDRGDKQSFLDTLKRSLSAVTQMRHPGLIRIHDAVTADTYAYLVMDLHNPDRNFRSFTASPAVRRKPGEILDALERVLEVLAYCHSTPVDMPLRGSGGVFVHGDLKAENVLIDYKSKPIVTDWLIPNLGRDRDAGFPYHDTRAYGTPMYMSPEQSLDGTVTPASDVWNFGILAFEAVTGYYPFEREEDIAEGTSMSVHRFSPLAPGWLEALIKHCLDRDARRRPADGKDLLDEWRRASFRPNRSGDPTTDLANLKRVFLSSTFLDLTAERDAVRRVLRKLGTVDVISMEERGAYGVPPREACLTEVETTHIMVLILGDSYGSVDSISGLSMTRVEYEHARNCGIPVLAYIKRRATPGGTILVPSPEDETDPRVQEFVEALDQVTYSSFAGPDDLSIQVLCDVARLVKSA